jgi:flavodoxin
VKVREHIALFYFSGTGNTRIIANLIHNKLQVKAAVVELINIEELIDLKKEVDVNQYDMIGIGYPIYGFGEPKIIQKFVQMLPKVDSKNVFVFKTAADFISINDNASSYLIRKLSKKGYNIFYDRIICMGSNFLIQYHDELVKQLYKCALNKVEILCEEVLKGKKRVNQIGFIFRIMMDGIHWFEDSCFARIFGRSLKVSKKCTQCGKCIKNCPSKNIYTQNNKIRFRFNCFLCMRCIYACPNNAIVSRGFGFIILKKGYLIEQIINNSDINDNYITEHTKGFMKHFQKYLEDNTL